MGSSLRRVGPVALILGSGIALVALGVSVRGDSTSLQSLDDHRWWVDSRVVQYRFKHRIWFDFAPRLRLLDLEEALNFTVLAIICVLMAILLLALRRPRASALYFAAVASGVIASRVLKPSFGRTVRSAAGDLTYTFPSGHTALLSGAVIAWILHSRRWEFAVAKGFVGAIAVTMYATLLSLTGSHFVTDCIGGILTSIIVVVGAHQVSALVFRQGKPLESHSG